MEALRTRLVERLEHNGFVDNLRSQVRAQLVSILQLERNATGFEELTKFSIEECALNALFSEFLRSRGHNYTLSVFVPEVSSKTQGGRASAFLEPADVARVLRLDPLLAQLKATNKQKPPTLIEVVVKEVSKSQQKAGAATQTDVVEIGQTLGEKLRKVEVQHELSSQPNCCAEAAGGKRNPTEHPSSVSQLQQLKLQISQLQEEILGRDQVIGRLKKEVSLKSWSQQQDYQSSHPTVQLCSTSNNKLPMQDVVMADLLKLKEDFQEEIGRVKEEQAVRYSIRVENDRLKKELSQLRRESKNLNSTIHQRDLNIDKEKRKLDLDLQQRIIDEKHAFEERLKVESQRALLAARDEFKHRESELLNKLDTANNNAEENEQKIKLMKDEILQLKEIVKISTQPVTISTQSLLPMEHESSAHYFSQPVQQPYMNLQRNRHNFTTYKSVPNIPIQRVYQPPYSHVVHSDTQPTTPAIPPNMKISPVSYQQSVIPTSDQPTQKMRGFSEHESPAHPKPWHPSSSVDPPVYNKIAVKSVSPPAYFEKYDENVKNRLRVQTDLEKRFDKLQKKASNFLKNQTSFAQKQQESPKKQKIIRPFGSLLNCKKVQTPVQFHDRFNVTDSSVNVNYSNELESTLVLEEKLAQIREERMVVQKELNARNEDWLSTTRQEMESQLRNTMEKRVREEVQNRMQKLQKEDAASLNNRTRIDDSDTTNLTQNTTLSTANTTGLSKATEEATFSTATGTLKSIPLLSPISPNRVARKLKVEQISKPLNQVNDVERVWLNSNTDLHVIREETGSRHGSNQGLVMSDLEVKNPPPIVKNTNSEVEVNLFPNRASNPKRVHVESREQVSTLENETLNFGLSPVKSKISESKESIESRSVEVLDSNNADSETCNQNTPPIKDKLEDQNMELSPERYDFDGDEDVEPEVIEQQDEEDGDSLLNAYRLRTKTCQHVSDDESEEAF